MKDVPIKSIEIARCHYFASTDFYSTKEAICQRAIYSDILDNYLQNKMQKRWERLSGNKPAMCDFCSRPIQIYKH